jgi:hypothetical protein
VTTLSENCTEAIVYLRETSLWTFDLVGQFSQGT